MTETMAGEARLEAGPPATWVIDADGHVVEPPDVWDRFLPRKYHSVAPTMSLERVSFNSLSEKERMERLVAQMYSLGGGTDPSRRLPDMDQDAIEQAVLFPTLGLMIQGTTERESALALCRAVNAYIKEYCDFDQTRLAGIGAIPSTTATDAVTETRRCVEELGFCGVFRRPEAYPGVLPIHDPSFESLWSYLEDANAPILIHPGQNPYIPAPYFTNRFSDYISLHAMSFVTEAMMALSSFVLYGILERHPRLRVGLVECGAVWALAYCHRLDEHVETFPLPPGVRLSRQPSEFFRHQCFVSAEGLEPGLLTMLEHFPESVVFASDYPHSDATFPGSTAGFLDSVELTQPQLQAILRDNALRLYGLRGT